MCQDNPNPSLRNSDSIFIKWIGWRDNLQETMDFPIKYH